MDRDTNDVLLEATRALLWASSARDAKGIVTDVVTAFGGELSTTDNAGPDLIPVDISFGVAEPVVPRAPLGSTARAQLERHLPSLMLDARQAIERGAQADRLTEQASFDSLTQLPNRRMMKRALARLQAGDTLVMLDIDHFKELNDTRGHDVGDDVLRALGRVLADNVRAYDLVARYGGDEFVILLHEATDPHALVERVRAQWESSRPQPITFSAGIAVFDGDAHRSLRAADRAMYRAKREGCNRTESATPAEFGDADVPESGLGDESGPIDRHPAFVAFSRLDVPDGGQDQLEEAFRERLHAVDRWPGFRRLEVWADDSAPVEYSMVSWWDSAEVFREYMRSDDHRRSHDRIPAGDLAPRPHSFRRFRVVAR